MNELYEGKLACKGCGRLVRWSRLEYGVCVPCLEKPPKQDGMERFYVVQETCGDFRKGARFGFDEFQATLKQGYFPPGMTVSDPRDAWKRNRVVIGQSPQWLARE